MTNNMARMYFNGSYSFSLHYLNHIIEIDYKDDSQLEKWQVVSSENRKNNFLNVWHYLDRV